MNKEFESQVLKACSLFDKFFPCKFIYTDVEGRARVQHQRNLVALYNMYEEAFEDFTIEDLLNVPIPQAIEYINNSSKFPIDGEFGILIDCILAYCNTNTGKVYISKAGRSGKREELQRFTTEVIRKHRKRVASLPTTNREMLSEMGLDESQIETLEALYRDWGISFKEESYIIADNLDDILLANINAPDIRAIAEVLLDGGYLGDEDSKISKKEWLELL